MITLAHGQRGAIIIMTALFIVLLLGFAALALDLGRLYVLRTEMQNAVDAAALAAAAELNGKSGARANARHAAKNLLSHQGRFANQPELLTILDDEKAFEFYSWIGAKGEGPKPSNCTSPADDPGKCLAGGDDDSHYVKVKLYPDLVAEGHYQINLYFLPVLGLMVDNVQATAETRASAVAGAGGAVICNLPPLMICDPAEAGQPLVPGQMVLIKEQGSGAWQPGNFGYLQPPEITGQLNKDMALMMANESVGGCSDPYVSTQTGVNAAFPRHGMNTRFGIYYKNIDWVGGEEAYPPAPNVVDYARDDNLTPVVDGSLAHRKSQGFCGFDTEERFGDNNLQGAGLVVTEDGECAATVNQADYYTTYHPLHSVGDPGLTTRYAYYQWELGVNPATSEWDWMLQPPGSTTRLPNRTTSTYDKKCFEEADPAKDPCRILDGDPESTQMTSPTTPGLPSRRIIYVAMLNCLEHGITGNTKDIYIGPGTGRFAKFLLTEHVSPPQEGVDIYAEYIGEVSEDNEDEYQHLIHKQIQLYE